MRKYIPIVNELDVCYANIFKQFNFATKNSKQTCEIYKNINDSENKHTAKFQSICKKHVYTLFFNIFVITTLFFIYSFAWADINNVYSAEVAIASKNDTDRTKAFNEAYKYVISNFSKDPTIINSPEVKSKLKNINVWVQSYSYTKRLTSSGQMGLFLKVTFDAQSIPKQIRSAETLNNSAINSVTNNINTYNAENTSSSIADEEKLPLTTKSAANTSATSMDIEKISQNSDTRLEDGEKNDVVSKTDILVWLVIIGNNIKTNLIIDDTHTDPITNYIENIAKISDFSLTFPAMDLQDITKITADDVCNQNIDILKNVSSRYGISNIAAGCIIQTDHGKRGQWLLLTPNDIYHWDINGKDDKEVLQQAFDSMSKALTPKQTIVPDNIISSKSSTDIKNRADSSQSFTPSPQLPTQTISSTNTAINNNIAQTTNKQNTDDEQLINANQVILYINNINNLDQYANAIQYVNSIPGTSKVELLSISLATIKLKVSINGGKNALLNELHTQNKLIPNSNNNNKTLNSLNNDSNNTALNYNWIP